MTTTISFLALALLILTVCSTAASLNFHSCPLFTNKNQPENTIKEAILPSTTSRHHFQPLPSLFSFSDLPRNRTLHAECATPSMPFIHGQEEGKPTLRVFVKRLLAADSNAKRGALFLLSGGPGGSATHFEDVMLGLQDYLPNYDMYYLEHRGVGRSHRLGCEAYQAETIGSEEGVAISNDENLHCAQQMGDYYKDATNVFSITQAANDLKSIIHQVKDQYSAGVTLYGISYGTLWAQRFLQLDDAPNGVDRVILDGVVSQAATSGNPTSRTMLNNWDLLMNQVGFDLMNLCDEQGSECANIIKDHIDDFEGEDYKYNNGAHFVKLVFDEVFRNDRCKSKSGSKVTDHWGFTEDETKEMLGNLLMQDEGRTLIPGILLRLLRCDDEQDFGVFEHIRQLTEKQKKDALARDFPGLASPVLGDNIKFSDIWDRDHSPSYNDLLHIFNSSHFASGVQQFVPSYEAWPKYNDPLTKKTFKNLNIPIMMLNGDLDPQTPFIFAEAQYNLTRPTCPNLKLFKIPYAVHFTLMNSKYDNVPENEPQDCSMNLMVQFTQNGFKNLNTSCIDRVRAPDFHYGSKKMASMILGTEDVWDGSYVKPRSAQTVGLYVFIACQAATVILSIIIICALVYCIVRLKDKQNGYENLDDEEQ